MIFIYSLYYTPHTEILQWSYSDIQCIPIYDSSASGEEDENKNKNEEDIDNGDHGEILYIIYAYDAPVMFFPPFTEK